MVRLGRVIGCLLALSASTAFAQEGQQLQQLYNDTLKQLQAAQDRKAELAAENTTLQDRVKKLEAELETARSKVNDLTDQTYRLRQHYATWQKFILQWPAMIERWENYIGPDLSQAKDVWIELVDADWPFNRLSVDTSSPQSDFASLAPG